MPSKAESLSYESLGRLVELVGDDTFPAAFFAALANVVDFDDAVALAYHQDDVPTILFDRLQKNDREIFYASYISGVYLASPFYQGFKNGCSSGIYRLRELAPDRFYQSEYYRRYYRHIGASDLLGYLFRSPKNGALLISIGRKQGARAFSKAEVDSLNAIEPVMRALSLRHWENPWQHQAEKRNLHQQFKQRFDEFGGSLLTQRELDVVRLLLMGHSSKSVAAELNITPDTVRVHRKNIYLKMEVRSHGELFSRFISDLTSG